MLVITAAAFGAAVDHKLRPLVRELNARGPAMMVDGHHSTLAHEVADQALDVGRITHAPTMARPAVGRAQSLL